MASEVGRTPAAQRPERICRRQKLGREARICRRQIALKGDRMPKA